MERGFFAFPVEIERALPTSTTTPTTTATTIRLIPALSPTQSTTESLPTSSTRLEIVEDVLKGFNLTHLTELEKEYLRFDFDQEIKTTSLTYLIRKRPTFLLAPNFHLPKWKLWLKWWSSFSSAWCVTSCTRSWSVSTRKPWESWRESHFLKETPLTPFFVSGFTKV